MTRLEAKKYTINEFTRGVKAKDIAIKLGEMGFKTKRGKAPSKGLVYHWLGLEKFKIRKKKKNIAQPVFQKTTKEKTVDSRLIKTILETNTLSAQDRIAMALLALQ